MDATSTVTIQAKGPWDLTNIKTGRTYSLIRADQVHADEKILRRIISVCNEPPIYEFIFRSILKGEPYAEANAKSFFDWSARGWREQKYFVFLTTDSRGEICGAADIKSNNQEKAEIGYWASGDHAGITSPAVGAMCDLAAKAGFESLFAFVKTSNPRSIAVLERNNFSKGLEEDNTKGYARHLYSCKFGGA